MHAIVHALGQPKEEDHLSIFSPLTYMGKLHSFLPYADHGSSGSGSGFVCVDETFLRSRRACALSGPVVRVTTGHACVHAQGLPIVLTLI